MRFTVKTFQALTAVGVVALGLSFSSAANAAVSSASGTGQVDTPSVLGITVDARTDVVAVQDTQVLGEVVDNQLAFTGADVTGLTILGGGAIVVGGALLAARRRRNLEA